MSRGDGVDDPLRFGAGLDEDMDDLTAHLANMPVGRGSHDDLDLSDTTVLQGNMDRFRSLADEGDDDPLTNFGNIGLGLPSSTAGAHPSTSASGAPITPANYPTYGQLAAQAVPAALPPSYEDSIHCDQAPATLGTPPRPGEGSAAYADPLMGPGPALPPAQPLAPPLAHIMQSLGQTLPLGREASPPHASAEVPASRLAVSEPAGSSVAGGAGQGMSPLELPGPGDYGEDLQALSPQRSARHGSAGAAGTTLVIIISDPIKREQGGIFGIKGGYVAYQVRAKSRAPSGAVSETKVFRRFREFVSLAELLKEKYRGYFVPPRPEKNAVEGQRMSDAFIEERRVALERYLNKLARHPVLSASDELRAFLTLEGELTESPAWAALRPLSLGGTLLDGTARFSKQILGLDRAVTNPVQAAQPTKKATDFMRAIKETAHKMHQTQAAPLPADEVALQGAKERLEGLQDALTTASRAAEKLMHKLDRWSLVNGEMGMSLFKLSKAEEGEGMPLAQHTGTIKLSGQIMHTTKRGATALVRVSRIGRKATGLCARELASLHEYLGLMPAALKGLRAREKARLTAETLAADLEGRRKAITDLEAAGAKVFGGDAAKAKKVSDLRGDVCVLEQSVVAARAQYERVKGINQHELSRLHGELRGDMASMLHRCAQVLATSAQRELEVWLQAAHELGASPEELQAAKAPLLGPAPGPHSAPPPPPPQPAAPQAFSQRDSPAHVAQAARQQYSQQQPFGAGADRYAAGAHAGNGLHDSAAAAAPLAAAPGSTGSMGDVDLRGPL